MLWVVPGASVIALYAAIVVTVSIGLVILNSRRDRSKIKLELLRNMVRDEPGRTGAKFVILRVTNTGHRSAGIKHAWLERSNRTVDRLIDARPGMPCLLTEGQQMVVFLDEARADFGTIKRFVVADSADHEYKLKT